MKTKAVVILSVILVSAVYFILQYGTVPDKAADFRDAPRETSALESLGKTNPAKVEIPDVPVAAPLALDAKVYQSLLHYRCWNSSKMISDRSARDIAELAAQDKVDVIAFKKAYHETCDERSALKIGMGAKSGAVSANVYQSLLDYRCWNSSKVISDRSAREIAELAAQDKVDVEAFKKAYYDSCNYESALTIGMGEKARISQKGGEKI